MDPHAPYHPVPSLDRNLKDYSIRYRPENGITLRDYIAIEAMKPMIQGALSSLTLSTRTPEELKGIDDKLMAKIVANSAYIFADALIAESNKKNDESKP